MTQLLSLFPPCEPFNFGFIEKDGHKIYYEQCGNPDGETGCLSSWGSRRWGEVHR